VKTLAKPHATPHAVTNFANRIASLQPLQAAIFAISVFVSAFCAIDGGYQLHLSHDHSALSCIDLTTAMSAGDQIDLAPLQTAPPVCKTPDEFGQPWRLKLVLRDMLGFVVFGTLCFYKTKHTLFASEPDA
jgi:hypothetical protein